MSVECCHQTVLSRCPGCPYGETPLAADIKRAVTRCEREGYRVSIVRPGDRWQIMQGTYDKTMDRPCLLEFAGIDEPSADQTGFSDRTADAFARAKEWVDNATPEQREAMRQAQRESWARGEMGMRDETTVVQPEPDARNGGPFAIGSDLWPGLSKLTEECGEVADLLPEAILLKTIGRVQQVAGKLIGAGGQENHWDGSNLRERITDELADLAATITFVIQKNCLDREIIRDRAARKLAKYDAWHAGAQQG